MLASTRPARRHERAPLHSSPTRPDLSLVTAPVGTPTITLVAATRPGPMLHPADRRRLSRRVRAVQLHLRRAGIDLETRHAIVQRLARLAATAREMPVGQGLALIASSEDDVLLHLRHPVRSRTLVGAPPTRLDLAEAAAVPAQLAILSVSPERARLLLAFRGIVREVFAGGLPRSRRRGSDPGLLPDFLREVTDSVIDALPPATPLVIAGDEQVARTLRDRWPVAGAISAVLPGDHRLTSPLALLSLSHRARDQALTGPQRRALAEVVLAREDGRLVTGLPAVRRAVTGLPRGLLVIERGLRDADPVRVRDARRAVEDREGRVVTVPDGRLLDCDRAALVAEALLTEAVAS